MASSCAWRKPWKAISSTDNMFSSLFSAVVPVSKKLLFNSLSEVAVKQELK